ncbi:MAG: S8 family peptidase, partial [Natronosporangium sp.]
GLASINGAAATVAKDQAGAFWHQLRGTPAPADARVAGGPAGLAGEVATVWLDRTAELVLDESVPLVGAPQAWDAGYDGTGVTVAVLDSGVDLNHPDLADRVVAAESFVDGAPPQDGHGHGTHVASTIAGTGAASDGRRTGVAPGAELVTGRVCTDAGQCPFSAMIAGMEWAAGPMDARVVSMSIGGAVTDGTDPLSQAVDSLTASSGALFVVAAGNNGDDVTVASPGAADAALTVAATDKQDRLAGFSSRGPRFGDLALKPDIAAPGVAIVAARAAGTSMGSPVDDWYTSAQGTSMATPHVSGAAAIVAQRHPDWSPAQLKAALMSTAADAGHTVYQQGAGRLDAGRAATQQLVATTANLDFGIVPIGPDGQPDPGPVTREISYRNLGEQPVTLFLAPALATTDGTPAPAGALVSDATVTVPAAGTATVAVTLDPSGLGEGTYTGAVVATEDASGTRLTTPVGLVREPPKFTLTVHTLDRAGEPRSPWAQDTLRLDGPGGPVAGVRLVDEGTTAVRVPAGTYSLTQAVDWVDAESRANTALLLRPELVVAGDTEITLDLRQAEQVSFSTPRPSEPLNNASAVAYQRTTQLGETFAGVLDTISATRLWATPTGEVDTGRFRFWTQALLGQAQVALTVLGPAGRTLHPAAPQHWSYPLGDGSGGERLVQDGHPGWVPFTGTQDLPLVDAGDGSTEALAGLDLAGKLALIEADGTFDNPFGAAACGIDILKIQNVRDAGAAGLVVFPSPDHVCAPLPIPLRIVQEQFTGPLKEVGIPNVHVSTQEGLDLRAGLAAGPVAVRVLGTPETPYSYVLKPYEEGRVPESLQYTLTDQQLAEVALDFHAPRATTYIEHRSVWKPDDLVKDALHLSDHGAPAFVGPQRRTEYFGPVSREVLHTRSGFGRQGGLEPEGYRHRWQRASFPEIFDQPGQARQQWYVAPKAPGARTGSEDVYQLIGPDAVQTLGMCTLCRQSGILLTHLPLVTGGPGSWQHDLGAGSSASLAEEGFFDLDFRLFRDGAEIGPLPGLPWAVFPMPAAPASYRMTAHGTQTEVTWTFTSSEPVEDTRRPGHTCFMETFFGSTDPCAPEPIVFASYDLAGSLELDNTVPARGAQRFSVTAYHSPSTAPMPAIAGLKLWVSYDGEQWTPARVRPAGDGRFDVTLVHPPARHRASDQVSLRVEAWDAAGNRIEQITRDAFTLSD